MSKSNSVVTQKGGPSERINHGNKHQQRLQISNANDGSVTVRGLYPGQKLFRLPDGRLYVTSQNSAKFALQPGVTLVATGASIPPIENRPVAINNIGVHFVDGDKIRMDSTIAVHRLQSQKQVGSVETIKKFLDGNVGTVIFSSDSKVSVKFQYLGSDMLFHFYPPFHKIEKLNVYPVNQLIRIRSDVLTVMEIEMKFQHQSSKMMGAIGRVTGFDEEDPTGKIFIQFDQSEINKCVPKGASLLSAWMDPMQSTHPSIDSDLLELASKEVALFLKAAEEGALRVAKLLLKRHGVDPESRNAEGKNALHIACQRGHKDLVEWLLDEVKVNVEQPDSRGFRAIHYACIEKNTEILKMLIERKVQVGSQTHCGRTALHISVLNQSVDCVRLLMHNDADANIQDSGGNTPLHIAISNRAYKCVDAMTPHFSFKWHLRNNEGFNIIHTAVVKNNLRIIKFIMEEQKMCDDLMELMPDSKATVLHFACVNRNYKITKLLVDGSKGRMLLDGSPLLTKLLEAKHENGATALLIACYNKDYATVEFLVESGANVKAVDKDGNTAILLASSSPATEEIPSKEHSPAIFKVYQSAVMVDSSDTKLAMESHPILSLIAYLKAKGASSEAALVIQESSGSISNPPTSANATSWIKKEIVEEEVCHDFNWISDGSKFGHVLDRMGNKYTRTANRKDGSVSFRCNFGTSFGRCSAVARRSQNESNGIYWTIKLESGHVHEAAGLKRKLDDDASPSPSTLKKERNYSGKKRN